MNDQRYNKIDTLFYDFILSQLKNKDIPDNQIIEYQKIRNDLINFIDNIELI